MASLYKTNSRSIEKEKSWILNRILDLKSHGLELNDEKPKFRFRYIGIDKLLTTETPEELEPSKLNKITTSIRSGLMIPPVAVDKKFNIHDGHHRYYSALNSEVKSIPVLIWLNPVIPGWVGWKRKEVNQMEKSPKKIRVAGILYEKVPEKIRVGGVIYRIAAQKK